MTDAIVRTLYRLFVSHRNLLEWVPAAQAQELRATDSWASTGGWRAPWRSALVAAIASVCFARHAVVLRGAACACLARIAGDCTLDQPHAACERP